ncbi:MAG TPA: YeeE/YedE thiosulfate transporter family protein [Candidatus Eisenbacteria bacterium]|nr:YeeE/YedE thiosulfate transporter family protein [Candidatus Eisenbacteria bacterium]
MMNTRAMSEVSAQLSVAEIEAMSQRQIKKHHVAIILLHWFNAIVWLLELATGVALISSPYFRFAPRWYIQMVQDVSGTRANMLRFHIAVGLTWTAIFLVYGTFGFKTYLHKEVLQREIALDRDDIRWLLVRVGNILRGTMKALPPQGVYNAGQKLFAIMVYMMIPLVMITGVIMGFHLISTTVVAWAVMIHFFAVGMVVSGLMIHVYMGAVFPEEKPAFFSMITGTVNELFAYRHHHKWWKEVAMERAAFEREMASGVVEPETLEPQPASGEHSEGNWLARALRQHDYWPPYAAGFGLGLTLLATFVVMGQGLGASSAFTRMVAWMVEKASPVYAADSYYWSRYLQPGQSVLYDFIVFEVVGAAIGGFVSGWLSGRLKITVDKGPRISNGKRYALALGGGILTGFGARLARGCTSGLALSGGAVLSVGAFVFMLSVFAAGFVGAYFMRRNWL